jgi:hypothetical protein
LAEYHIADPGIEVAIERSFRVAEKYIYFNQPTYVVVPRGDGDPRLLLKSGFEDLVSDIRPLGYLPKLRQERDRFIVTVHKVPEHGPPSTRRNVILFIATVCTVFLDGYLRSNNPILTEILMPGTSVYLNALYFTLAILGVFGLHEFGHKAISMIRGIEASMPYFIPAPPGMGGTFGAVITQKEPPTNRDALFDLGLSGPLVGFIVTIIVAILGLRPGPHQHLPPDARRHGPTAPPGGLRRLGRLPRHLHQPDTRLAARRRPHKQGSPGEEEPEDHLHRGDYGYGGDGLLRHGPDDRVLHDED